MYATNSAGGGVAWREDGWVRWAKGLSLEEMQDFCKKLPLPFVAHFRIPTVGGAISELCHPFPVDGKCSVALEGRTKGYVLFHNGHWGDWKRVSMEAATKGRGGLPVGKWSDSRAMAFVAHIYGVGILDFIDEHTIIFGPHDSEVTGSRWTRANDVVVSNRSWEFHSTTHTIYRGNRTGARLAGDDMCGVDAYARQRPNPDPQNQLPAKYKQIGAGDDDTTIDAEEKPGGASQPVSFRNDSTDADGRQDQQKQVEKAQAGAGKVEGASKEGTVEDESNPALIRRWACSLNPNRFKTGGRGITPIAHPIDEVRRTALGIEKAITIP